VPGVTPSRRWSEASTRARPAGSSPVAPRWTLTPTRDGSRLTLENTFDERADRGMHAAGWHLCLAVLAAVLDGHDVDRVVGSRANDYGWSALRDRYDANLG
jgi:hypothetical protein